MERARATATRRPAAAPPTPEHVTNPIVWLQRQAGNMAVAGLLAQREADAPAAPATKVKHIGGKQVDKYLLANSFLKPYVKPKMAAGKTGAAAVKIEPAADFLAAWLAYAPGREHPRTGQAFTRATAEAWEPNVNAFQDGGVIHVHEMRGDPGTTLHETLHLLSDQAFIDLVGYHMNEGVTDFLTHLVAGKHHIERTYNFSRQMFVVDRMVMASSKEKLADAYFKNSIDGLKSDVEKKGGDGAWAKLLGYMQAENFGEATKLVK